MYINKHCQQHGLAPVSSCASRDPDVGDREDPLSWFNPGILLDCDEAARQDRRAGVVLHYVKVVAGGVTQLKWGEFIG